MEQTEGILETMRGLEPKRFEELIADIWQERQNWDTKPLQGSRDHGVDVIGQPPGGGPKTALQAKRYGPGNPVREPQIREYAALRQQHPDVEGVTVVTTGRFTKSAREIADHLDVKLINGEQLARLVVEYDAIEILEWYDAGKPRDWYE